MKSDALSGDQKYEIFREAVANNTVIDPVICVVKHGETELFREPVNMEWLNTPNSIIGKAQNNIIREAHEIEEDFDVDYLDWLVDIGLDEVLKMTVMIRPTKAIKGKSLNINFTTLTIIVD